MKTVWHEDLQVKQLSRQAQWLGTFPAIDKSRQPESEMANGNESLQLPQILGDGIVFFVSELLFRLTVANGILTVESNT